MTFRGSKGRIGPRVSEVEAGGNGDRLLGAAPIVGAPRRCAAVAAASRREGDLGGQEEFPQLHLGAGEPAASENQVLVRKTKVRTAVGRQGRGCVDDAALRVDEKQVPA